MTPLEQLFPLGIEFHRRLRSEAPGTADDSALHTGYALQSAYEMLLKSIGRVTLRDIEQLADHLAAAGDSRYVLTARVSIAWLLGLRPYS